MFLLSECKAIQGRLLIMEKVFTVVLLYTLESLFVRSLILRFIELMLLLRTAATHLPRFKVRSGTLQLLCSTLSVKSAVSEPDESRAKPAFLTFYPFLVKRRECRRQSEEEMPPSVMYLVVQVQIVQVQRAR
jgi:hypothetical protein